MKYHTELQFEALPLNPLQLMLSSMFVSSGEIVRQSLPACDGTPLSLACPSGYTVNNVVYAEYGRPLSAPASRCPYSYDWPDHDCVSPYVGMLMDNLLSLEFGCLGVAGCNVEGPRWFTALNDFDPCVGTSKYVRITFVCGVSPYQIPPPADYTPAYPPPSPAYPPPYPDRHPSPASPPPAYLDYPPAYYTPAYPPPSPAYPPAYPPPYLPPAQPFTPACECMDSFGTFPAPCC